MHIWRPDSSIVPIAPSQYTPNAKKDGFFSKIRVLWGQLEYKHCSVTKMVAVEWNWLHFKQQGFLFLFLEYTRLTSRSFHLKFPERTLYYGQNLSTLLYMFPGGAGRSISPQAFCMAFMWAEPEMLPLKFSSGERAYRSSLDIKAIKPRTLHVFPCAQAFVSRGANYNLCCALSRQGTLLVGPFESH